MDIQKIVISQYKAALLMFKDAVSISSEELWYGIEKTNAFWHIAYHTLFYTDLYLSVNLDSFVPWDKHKENYNLLDKTLTPSYNKSDIFEYYEKIIDALELRIRETDFEAPSGFYWLKCNKLELHIYNIRHIQHHAGQLIERIRDYQKQGINWVSFGDKQD